MKFQKVRYVFLSNLHPDFYGGFPGFYLSAREGFGGADLKDFRIGVFGPKHLRKLIKNGKYFYSGYQSLDVYEYGIVKTPFRTKYGF
jgi:ribonuclease BN (tRNA processing enzyme)